jgi:pyrroline-5-carboxylate reductase
MAASLIGGLLAAGHPAARLRVAETAAERADWLRREFAVTVVPHAAQVAADADALVLAVKPQQMAAALAGLRPPSGALVLSIAAGVRLASLQRRLGEGVQLVRSMPNTPALLRAGISGLYAPPSVTPAARALAEHILRCVGDCVWLADEAQLDAVTALSGSGPAYFFFLVEALREAGAGLGLPAATAARLALATFTGAARMVQSGTDVAELRAQVTSKGGTTQAALRVLEDGGLRELLAAALRAASARARELGEALERDGP